MCLHYRHRFRDDKEIGYMSYIFYNIFLNYLTNYMNNFLFNNYKLNVLVK